MFANLLIYNVKVGEIGLKFAQVASLKVCLERSRKIRVLGVQLARISLVAPAA
jgi:hypothetical protein